MPCHEKLSQFPSFPPDIELDTLHFHQALAEHNLARSEADLPIANFLELSAAERHDVLSRAQAIKEAHRPRVIFIDDERAAEKAPEKSPDPILKVPIPIPDDPDEHIGALGFFLLLVGVCGMMALIVKFL